MGQRGPGAKPVKLRQWVNPVGKVAKSARKVKQPWDAPGLTRAERVVVFLETLPISSGNLSGENFKVRGWQRRDIIDPIYATDESGRRAVRESFISIPRKNGKSGLVAGLGLCHLCGPESVERGQVVSAAAERAQSGIIFTEMCAIIERTQWMAERLSIKYFSKEIHDVETGSKYMALSAESKTKYGKSLSFWIYDELAQAHDQSLYDALSTSGAAWPEPLGIVISTQSGDPKHIMSVLYDDARQILDGVVEDPSKHACIYSAPMEADPWAEETWRGCNPALGDFRSFEEMRDFANKAKRMPSLESTFRLLYLNQRVSAEARFLPPAVWDLCGENAETFNAAALKGQHCFGGLDLSGSGKNDLTALTLVFDGNGQRKALPFFWAAEGGLDEAEGRDRVPYKLWAKDGHLLTTPGALLDYDFIAAKIAELSTQYQIESIAVDPWNIDRIDAALEKIKAKVVLFKHDQHFRGMDPAVTELENAALAGKLRHNKNPVLTWCMDNVMVSQDSTGNRKFDKRKSTGRIDGAVAVAMACNLAAARPAKQPEFQMLFI